MAGNTVYVQGSYVDVHDNEVVNLSIDKAGEVHVDRQEGTVVEDKDEAAEAQVDDSGLIARLQPIFYNNESDVRAFLKEIVGMKPNDITDLVNNWVQQKRISDYGYSRKGALWDVLNDAGLYTRSKQNWCRRVY